MKRPRSPETYAEAAAAADGDSPCTSGGGEGGDDVDDIFGSFGAREPAAAAGLRGPALPRGMCVEHVPGVPGLRVARGFAAPEEAAWLLASATAEGWATDPVNNQAMRFGSLPEWVALVVSRAERCAAQLLPECAARRPLFDSLICNRYEPGEGLVPHVDLLRFADGVAGLTLCGSAALRFEPAPPPAAEGPSAAAPPAAGQRLQPGAAAPAESFPAPAGGGDAGAVEVFLGPGDLYAMSGDARYRWRHGIPARAADAGPDGAPVPRSVRVSLTLRRLVPDP
eukprot:TRINITY_DN37501_c0_g1_i1.p2 TRINITY_DN37501_c0_g1~~TRINITY_DN37501_c0_g1_i1.p2  ORF type:complete len:282 (+),score=72.49 TRINITY_DN37501_c0_g1_i1:89-934(+)